MVKEHQTLVGDMWRRQQKTEEQQQTVTQEHIYPTTLREVINYRQTGRKEDVPDDLSWHTCDQVCTQPGGG